MYYRYELEQGGVGIVFAYGKEEARQKVIDAYTKHSTDGFTEEVYIHDIERPFEDAPEVIEVYD